SATAHWAAAYRRDAERLEPGRGLGGTALVKGGPRTAASKWGVEFRRKHQVRVEALPPPDALGPAEVEVSARAVQSLGLEHAARGAILVPPLSRMPETLCAGAPAGLLFSGLLAGRPHPQMAHCTS